MQKLSFTKMNGAGNDFVLLDNRGGEVALGSSTIARLCDRHRGVGADGILLVEAPTAGITADFRMRYFNADGGEADMCGNGARCFARYAARLTASTDGGSGTRDGMTFQTGAGLIRARFDGKLVHLDMSQPTGGADLGALTLDDGSTLPQTYFLNTGVPHVVVPVDDVEAVDVHPVGRALRYHRRFAPQGANANFIQPYSMSEIILRTYERGVEGETLACGTGATASALVHAEMNDLLGVGSVAVRVRSGDVLRIGFERLGPFQFQKVTLGGPADFVFRGEIAF